MIIYNEIWKATVQRAVLQMHHIYIQGNPYKEAH